MKILIIYDSVSPAKLTEKIAKTIEEIFNEKGIGTKKLFVSNVNLADVLDSDCLIVGSPVMKFRATGRIRKFLETLPDSRLNMKLAAAFDTRLQTRMSGSATKGIENKLKELGLELVVSPLITFVEGSLRKNEWRLKDGELEKAKIWAAELIKTLSKQSVKMEK
jgi:flavodoxin